MIGKLFTSAFVLAFCYACSTWLYLYGKAETAILAAKQFEDSTITNATVRWINGGMPSTILAVVGALILVWIWYKPASEFYDKLTKEKETNE